MNDQPIIIALDVESADDARTLVRRIGKNVNFYKVGMELYAAAGMTVVRELLDEGKEVFLDLKFYDIPETVKRAVAQVARTGVRFLTIHAVPSVMRAAVEGKDDSRLQLLGVTVLTSIGPDELREMGHECSAADLVAARTSQAKAAGVDGVVCSPLEAAAVRAIGGPDLIIVTPGVRSAGAAKGDQKRVATPAEAIQAGANYVVVGRQVTRAADPAGEAARVLEEMAVV